MFASELVDSHLHLQDYGPGVDIGAIIEESVQAGVSVMVCNGTSEEDWPKVLELAKSHLEVIPCFGVHPWFVTRRSTEWLPILERFICENRCGVGEIGLDKLAEPFDRASQEDAFRIQLELARKYKRPAMIHCVKMWGPLMDILQSGPELPCGMLLHAYGGSVDLVKPLAKLGAYFSFSGTVLIDRFKHAREALLAIPPERLLIESDAPNMLPPEGFRPRTVTLPDGKELNHPANLPAVLDGVAHLLGEPPDALKTRLWENSKRFFAPITASQQ